MEVLRKCYEVTCSLREYVELHLHEFSASEALESFMNSSVVACNGETNMRLDGACTKTRNNRNETTGTTGTKPPEQPERPEQESEKTGTTETKIEHGIPPP